MKKYILNLFEPGTVTNRNQPQYADIRQGVQSLAYYIALYNHAQPEQDFINYLKNSLAYEFLYYPIGEGTTSDGEPHTYDVQFYDDYRRVGTIQVIETKS